MSSHSVLYYATPPRRPLGLRVNRLAVFAFCWTFGASPAAGLGFLYAWAAGNAVSPGTAFVALGIAALIGVPAVAAVSAHAAVERGAAWDSAYCWTELAAWAAPFATLMTSGGVVFWVRAMMA